MTIDVNIEFSEVVVVISHEDVMVLESQFLCLGVEFPTHREVACLEVRVAPGEKHHSVDEQCEEEIDEHAAYHDEQSLPCGLCAELPRLRRLLHLFGVETLVYHSRYLAIASQREPSDAVGGVRLLRLEFKKMEPRVEEEVELLYSYAEEF